MATVFQAPAPMVSWVNFINHSGTTEPLLPLPNTVTQDRWDRGQSLPRWGVKRATEFPAFTIAPTALTLIERTTPHKYYTRTDPYPYKAKMRALGWWTGENLHVVPAAENLTIDKWRGIYPDTINRLKRTAAYPSSVADQI